MKYVASSISQMTDYDKYYVYTGHEEGMVTGCWYFWSGTEWLIGGDYQCGIDDIIETNSTMDEEGMPADAKAVGDMIVVSNTEPTSPHTELWIDPDTESVLVPTMDDIESTYAKKSEVESTYARKAAVGSPLRAATASAMTDVTKIYVYTGSESGYTSGHWYYYDGSSWADGGVYNSTAFVTDKTLTGDGEAADAKTVGDEVTNLKSALEPLQEDSYNKLNVNNLTANKYEPTGVDPPKYYNGWSLSDYIPMTQNDTCYMVIENTNGDGFINVTGANLYCGYYNAEKVKIVGSAGSPIKLNNENLAFVRVSTQTGNFSKHAMVVDETTRNSLTSISDYKPYSKITYPVVDEIETLKVEVADVVNDVDAIKRVIGEENGLIDSDVTAIIDKIPDYYIDYLPTPTTSFDDDSYLESKIKQIPEGYSFIHIADVHCDHGTTYNAWHSIDLMNYVRKRANIDKVIFSGDILNVIQNTYDEEGHVVNPGKYGAKKELAKFLYGCRRAFGSDFLPTVGDHDANLSGTIGTENVQDGYEGQYVPYAIVEPLFFGDVKNRHCAIEYYQSKLDAIHDRMENPISDADYNELKAFFKTVFYVDDDKNKIRWIVMNCGKSGARYDTLYNIFGIISTEIFRVQYDWLNDALTSIPTGYNVILHSHKASFNSGSMRGAIKMLNAFKNKGTTTPDYTTAGSVELEAWWNYTKNYNYSNAPDCGWVLSMNGHTHADDIYVRGGDSNFTKYTGEILTENQIPCIEINCDAYNTAVGHVTPMELGTITEHCFDVVTIVEDGIVMTRFGAGNDRRIYINRS